MSFSIGLQEKTKPLKNGSTKTVLSVCLKCENIEECKHIERILREEYEGEDNIEDFLCLIKVDLHIYSKLRKSSDTGVYYTIELTDFYNNVTKYGKGLSYLHSKLKGGAFAVFCILLIRAIRMDLIKEEDIITLKASGDLDDREMTDLIRYYESLGFVQSDPHNIMYHLDEQEVPMHGKVKDVINECKKRFDTGKVSPELSKILQQIL